MKYTLAVLLPYFPYVWPEIDSIKTAKLKNNLFLVSNFCINCFPLWILISPLQELGRLLGLLDPAHTGEINYNSFCQGIQAVATEPTVKGMQLFNRMKKKKIILFGVWKRKSELFSDLTAEPVSLAAFSLVPVNLILWNMNAFEL